ncbi:hypothetical protein PK98_09095 [Croceibacterium mercuriale]|uniref:Pectinesterase catalytic domain-containing protein n=1 Tax=Croceibacterium mercuriale TaxID=1572751 RepID=A0A0B2BYK1_9SPHN|nr:pectinesterase family protein [Croceibacterium mercuriale]KHL26539.1 hypothetical protein PK98_09095 [Croceibacterium mercuriale]
MNASALLLAPVLALLAVCSPAGAQDTLAGLGHVQGYTGIDFDTRAERYDILVDASRPEDPASGRYRTIHAAYAAAPAGMPGRPTIIGLMPDVYQLNGTEADTGLHITKPDITLLGLTQDRRSVVLADNRGNRQGASNNGFSMMVDADGFSAINLTILNHCNLDYEYPGDSSKNLARRSDVITQAVALQARGDRHVYSHVAFLSRLDTLFNMTERSYFTHSYLEGTDDYLGAPGASVWEDSEINFIEGGGILFAGGTTFIRTRFRATRTMQFYKVPVAPVALIESILPDVPIAWFGWRAPETTSEHSLTWHTKTGAGQPVTIVDSIVGEPRHTIARELTDGQAQAFHPWNLLRWTAEGVDDGWDPAAARASYQGAGPLPFRLQLTEGAIRLRTGEAPAEISARVSPPGSTRHIRWNTASPLVTLSAAEGDSVVVTAANHTDDTQVVPIEVRTDNGFVSRAFVTVDPAYRPAPVLAGAPVIRPDGPQRMRLDYTLGGLDGRTDRSPVTWLACADATCTRPEVVAVSRGDVPLQELAISPGLAGRYIMATVAPRHDLSRPGPAQRSAAVRTVSAEEAAIASADFRSLPDSSVAGRWEGDWRLTGAWSSEAPLDDRSWGLRVGREDSTLLYVGRPSAGDMDVSVVLDTDKLEGQGFSIPGAPQDDGRPRADILFKYDPATRSGYALRFWRSTRSATAVVFQLYRITDGQGTPLGPEDQLTGVLKPQTTIRISVRGGDVTVSGTNTADTETLNLTGTIDPNGYGGAGFYWTASGFGGSAVLRAFEVDYRPDPSTR